MQEIFEQARKALDFLEQHRLDPTAGNYAFALYYIKNPESDLAEAVDFQTQDGVRLSAASMLKIAERYSPSSSNTSLDQRERTVARQAEELGTLTSDAHDITAALGRGVGAFAEQVDEWPKGTDDLVVRLSDAERELADLRDAFRTLRDEVAGAGRHAEDADDEVVQALDQSGARQILNPLIVNGRPYVMMMFSIDDLAGINERFGRTVGTNVLSAFAATLREVFPEAELIRWTGNEFMIVTTGYISKVARLMAEEALAALRARRLKLRGSGEWIGPVTASAGIVVGQGEPLDAVLSRVRASKQEAAAQGGGMVGG
jgi:diguanylate cyclase